MNNVIVEAIQAKKQLMIGYKGAQRVVEPHSYGLDKAGKLKLRAYQTKETSATDLFEGWRLFDETKIESIRVVDSEFNTRVGYNPEDKLFSQILAKI